MKSLKKIIVRNATGKKVLLLFILTSAVYLIMMTVTIPNTMAFSGGLKILDMMPGGYDTTYINTLFVALGENGRKTYLYHQIPVDMVYPFLFGISYCLLMGYFLEKLGKIKSSYFLLCLLPLIAGTADYLENFGIIVLLNTYPEQTMASMGLTSAFSLFKSITTTLSFLVLLGILLLLGYKTFKKRSADRP